MTSPQPPDPRRAAAGPAVNEESTLHLPLTTPGQAVPPPGTARRTMPSPYPARAPFRAPDPIRPPPVAPVQPGPGVPAAPAPAARWQGTGFRPDIQGLRAVAVVLVLLTHAGLPFMAGGYVGVDVFFVVSGFLITSLLVEEVFATRTVSIAGFYARRARRILPAASVVTIATVAGAALWYPITRLESVLQDAFTVVVYVVNFRFVAEQTQYLNADQLPSPFQQYWSLAVEEQFYLVWPLLLLGAAALSKRDPRKAVRIGLGAIAAVFALSLVASVFLTEATPAAAYYATHTRVWELAAGALLALSLPTWRRLPKAVAAVLGIAGLAAVVGSAFLYDAATPFPGYTALLPVVGTMLVIAAGTGWDRHPAAALLATGPFQYVGKISYSLYLWHWPVLILIPLAIGAEPSLVLNLALLAAVFALSQLSYLLVEQPMRGAKLLKSHSGYGIGAGILCSLLALGTVVATSVTELRTAQENQASQEIQVDDIEGLTATLTEGAQTQTLPEDLQPPLESVAEDYPRVFADGCFLSFNQTASEADCVYGSADADTTVVLFGDSHAAQWFPAVESIALERDWRVVVRSKASCPVPDVTVDHPSEDREYSECDQWRGDVVDYLGSLKPALVIATSSVFYDLPGEDDAAAWASGWERTLTGLKDSGAAVVTLSDTPRTPWNVPDCLATHQDEVPECVPPRADALPNGNLRDAESVAQSASGATVIDVVPWFCLEDVCPVVVEHLQVYRDRNHITVSYISSLAPLLAERLPVQ
ncbi:acyltransferase family protein [Glycomyces mayteni]|uniref:Acyltransferase family protein n=1 Tax=Glycomyces mayteni TaxID=543887 RepID=A0ABW2DB11_9ACTN|nr:SGNH hydrolase domain-containing protein [Glycomyces mayteni]